MTHYDPLTPPDPKRWLALDEGERHQLVIEYHSALEDEFEDDSALDVHALVHVVIENQLANRVDPVPETLARLIRQGLDRHDAIHAIGSIVLERFYTGLRSDETDLMPKYVEQLKNLTAKRWLSGKL